MRYLGVSHNPRLVDAVGTNDEKLTLLFLNNGTHSDLF